MTVCLPASQFCCGCSVGFGVKLLLVLHFLVNLYFVAKAGSVIILQSHAFGDPALVDMTRETLIAGWCLVGLPIIVMAMWGVFQRIETLVRLYFAYFFLSWLFDMTFILFAFVLQSPCNSLPDQVVGQSKAFACGIARSANFVVVLLLTMIQLYMVFIVWSYCEDLAEGGANDFGDLSKDAFGYPISQYAMQKRRMQESGHASVALNDVNDEDPYSSMLGGSSKGGGGQDGPDGQGGGSWMGGLIGGLPIVGDLVTSETYGSAYAYESAASSGLGPGGSNMKGLFGHRYHEVRYPPPPMGFKSL
mmetsp:Transcript_110916/g.312685  ORF Transcript_110916/g.312685 Transcript_110916/m.312685 type:complete len:304 (-) Transcript_110916:133-1044(-)